MALAEQQAPIAIANIPFQGLPDLYIGRPNSRIPHAVSFASGLFCMVLKSSLPEPSNSLSLQARQDADEKYRRSTASKARLLGAPPSQHGKMDIQYPRGVCVLQSSADASKAHLCGFSLAKSASYRNILFSDMERLPIFKATDERQG
ncbi:hypothetical protein [Chitinimonas sp. JJ19]|uniref:hypothetical protein n=1 Tax=Chitinimonas sp. JJ19 TaxID=3109352 RepID=UPI0030015D98